MARITSVEELEALYGAAGEASLVKVADRVTPEYRALIEAAPFATLATVGPEGVDCSPRGDRPGFVRIHDARTLMLPDRRGNNRVDSLRNILRDPRVALMFLIPGWGNAIRVNGRAYLEADPALCESFAVDGRPPRSVVVIAVEEVYFQCARAVIRAGLWDPARHAAPGSLPSPGRILASLSGGRVGGADYDARWADRAKESMW